MRAGLKAAVALLGNTAIFFWEILEHIFYYLVDHVFGRLLI